MEQESARFRLVIRANSKSFGGYAFVITRRDNPQWSKVSLERFGTLDEAADAGRLALERLENLHRADHS